MQKRNLIRYSLMLVPIALAAGFWLTHRTTASEMSLASEFHEQVDNGRPTYVRFFMNT